MAAIPLLLLAVSADPSRYESARYGVAFDLPDAWTVKLKEREEYVVVAKVPGGDAARPGAFACELALAPESLEEYRTRIDGNFARGRTPGRLLRNAVEKTPRGDRLVTLREFRPPGAGVWNELTVRVIAHRQMYAFVLNVDAATMEAARAVFDDLVDGARFSPPAIGVERLVAEADREDPSPPNRWAQSRYKFALTLPDGWGPALAPSEVAAFFANGPAQGIWADNVVVVARPHRGADLDDLARAFPEEVRREDPNCEVLACKVVPRVRDKGRALETIVRTRRGPFSMTVIEHRFRGDRFDYEVKFTIETMRFDALEGAARRGLESFEELPGEVAIPRGGGVGED